MNEELETLEIAFPKTQPQSIKYICALQVLLRWFKALGVTHEQLQKGFDYCMYTHADTELQ